MLKIREIQAIETYDLRLKVLKTSEKYIYKYQGDFDTKTKHFGAFLDENCIGIVSVMKNSLAAYSQKQIQLRGMAVAPKMQGKNVGKQLIQFIEKQYKQKNVSLIWCNAREYAVPFYKKLGFESIGDKFYIEHVCFHYKMIKNI